MSLCIDRMNWSGNLFDLGSRSRVSVRSEEGPPLASSFLENVLTRLRTGGFLASARYGAYRLKNAAQLRRFGISAGLSDASEIVPREQLGLDNPDCSDHQATSPFHFAAFRTAMHRFVKPSQNDVFIDYGSGLGAAMLMAATLPFRKIVGIEISDELSDRAAHIISRYKEQLLCQDFEFVTSDAKQYDLPADASVIYFFNPFRGEVMRGVFAKIDESLTRHPREIRILFNFPYEIEKLSDRFPWLSKCGDVKDPWSAEEWIEVYRGAMKSPKSASW
jgi:hypothetical protein